MLTTPLLPEELPDLTASPPREELPPERLYDPEELWDPDELRDPDDPCETPVSWELWEWLEEPAPPCLE